MICHRALAVFSLSLRRSLSIVALLTFSIFGSGCGLIGAGVATAGVAASTAIALAPIKLMFMCLPEGALIDTPGGSQAIETLKAGDLVIGYDGEPVRIQQIHGYLEDPENSEFLEIGFSCGASVDLCTMHRLGGIRAKELKLGDVVVGGHSIVSIRPYQGVERSYDLLTEDAGYRVAGIPVNSMIVEMYEAGRSGNVKH
ncbi:MAG: Hint domain-containing protein [Verrucomicrobiales bacterium]|nr:Hint domain-containing protein [Verrucomicrobiales bacterium]